MNAYVVGDHYTAPWEFPVTKKYLDHGANYMQALQGALMEEGIIYMHAFLHSFVCLFRQCTCARFVFTRGTHGRRYDGSACIPSCIRSFRQYTRAGFFWQAALMEAGLMHMHACLHSCTHSGSTHVPGVFFSKGQEGTVLSASLQLVLQRSTYQQ